MLVICNFNEGYPDITKGKIYKVINECDNGYEIIDDNGDLWCYMKALFEVVVDER